MKSKDSAKTVNLVVYIVLVILSLATGLDRNYLPQPVQMFTLIYFIITIIFLDHISKDKSIPYLTYAKCNTLFITLSAIVMGIETRSTSVYLMVLFVPLFTLLPYIDNRIYIFLYKVEVIQLTILLIIGFPWMSGRPENIETILFYVIITGASCICMSFTKSLEFQKRKSFEQEQSLDDMLRIVSVKCDEARSATKSKSSFLSNMSHEIRTPINAILGMNELILRECDDRKIVEYAANIENSGKMLLSLVNDILDFSKIEAGKMELVNVEYQMSSVLNDIVNMIKPRADEKKLKFEIEVNKEMPNILFGDEVRIKQLIVNLLTNAVKYTDSGSVKLLVDYTTISDDCIEIYIGVKDTGRGIKDEDQKNLFESFRRVSEKENYNIEGTGLGLSITQRILDMMGGTINVESEYGKGSLFYIRVNQKVNVNEPIGDFKKQFEKSISSKAKYKGEFTAPDAAILVVDDNIMNIEVVKGLLKNTKVKIDTATSGKACIELLKENKYDIVLLDHMMPGMDGVDTLKVIKQEKIAEDTPIVALTANAVSGAREMYFEYGFNDYLTKPISGIKLEKAIRHWLPDELVHEVNDSDGKDKPAMVLPGPVDEDNAVYDIQSISSSIKKSLKSEDEKDGSILPKFIDIDQAMMYSADGMDGIMANIRLYITNYDSTKPKLIEMYKEDNYSEYSIYAHSLGSTSATIGAMELSKLARAMEKAGVDGDKNYIKVHHEQMIQMYDDVIRKLKDTISDYEADNVVDVENEEIIDAAEIQVEDNIVSEVDKKNLIDILERLSAASDEFDSLLVDDIMEELNSVRISDSEIVKKRKELAGLNEECEYLKIVDLCNEMLEMLKLNI